MRDKEIIGIVNILLIIWRYVDRRIGVRYNRVEYREGRLVDWKVQKLSVFFLTGIISIYLLYYGFIQKVFVPLDNELYGAWLIVLDCMRRSMYFGVALY